MLGWRCGVYCRRCVMGRIFEGVKEYVCCCDNCGVRTIVTSKLPRMLWQWFKRFVVI